MKRAHTSDVGGNGFAVNGEAMNAELEAGRDLRQRRLGAFAAGEAVGDDADMVAAVGLSIGEVQDVTEDAADRRAHRVQDTKRLIWNSRAMVRTSVRRRARYRRGRCGVPSGTTKRDRTGTIGVGQGHAVAPGARREAAGDRHRAFDAHIGHVGILAGSCDFAEDEERPVGFDLDRHRGIADIAVAQFGR